LRETTARLALEAFIGVLERPDVRRGCRQDDVTVALEALVTTNLSESPSSVTAARTEKLRHAIGGRCGSKKRKRQALSVSRRKTLSGEFSPRDFRQ